ncbi:MAG TPA: DUF6298 domain-containing protein [Candidatus Binatia bacterium]
MNRSSAASAAFAGPLRRNSVNPRYFTDGTGKAIYLTGSHTWSNFKDFGAGDPPLPFDYDGYLDFLQSHNHNFFRLWTWELPYSAQNHLPAQRHTPFPWPRTGSTTATDGKPKFDLARFDQTYFDRLRQRVMLAGQRGIYVSVMLWDGFGPQFERSATDGFPFDAANNINGVSSSGVHSQNSTNPKVTEIQRAYARKVVDTLNDLDNVLFEIANEAGSYSTIWQYQMIDFVKRYEAGKPKQHPVGMTFQYSGGTDAALFRSIADWISPQDRAVLGNGMKVILNDTDHSYSWKQLKQDGQVAQQAWVWKAFTNGTNPLFMDPYLQSWTGRNDPTGREPDAYWETLRVALGRTKLYADKMNLNRAAPGPGLFSSRYGLANAVSKNGEYLGFLPGGGSITIDLSASRGILSVEWFNPTSGATTTGGTVTGGASRVFTAPFAGNAVVYARSVGPPSPPTNVALAPD